MVDDVVAQKITLPAVNHLSNPMLQSLTEALGVDRNVLASDREIAAAWRSLPDLLSQIPLDKRDEGIMRMCVAVAAGLFDAAVNYAWNAAIIELRQKILRFGVTVIPQIINSDFDENKLMEMQDSELLRLCLKLNLVSETGYFMLDHCRDIRNNFSAAHPAIGALDEYEFLTFLNRCGKHALSEDPNTEAIDIKEFMTSLNAGAFTSEQYQIWNDRIVTQIRKNIHGLMQSPYVVVSRQSSLPVLILL